MRTWCVFILALACPLLLPAQDSLFHSDRDDTVEAAACPASFNVGFQIVPLSQTPFPRSMAVWYPTTAKESAYVYNDSIRGSVALNAAVTPCAKFPLVLFSHGDGGCGTQSVFITEQLARSGMVVVAPDHQDAACRVDGSRGTADTSQVPSFLNVSAWTNQSVLYRRDDLQLAKKLVLAMTGVGTQVDRSKIAVMGHSLGGYAAYGWAGGWSNWTDSEIKAAVLLSPWIQPFLQDTEAKRPSVPVMFQGGTADVGITPWINGTRGNLYDQSATPKFFQEYRGKGHFAWTNQACSGVSKPVTVANCVSSLPAPRQMVDSIRAFLRHYLQGLDQPGLWVASSEVSDFRRLTPLTVSSGATGLGVVPLQPGGLALGDGDALSNSAVTARTAVPSLGGVDIVITDSAGISSSASLLAVAPGRVSFRVPGQVQLGTATATVRLNQKPVAAGQFVIQAIGSSSIGSGVTTPRR